MRLIPALLGSAKNPPRLMEPRPRVSTLRATIRAVQKGLRNKNALVHRRLGASNLNSSRFAASPI